MASYKGMFTQMSLYVVIIVVVLLTACAPSVKSSQVMGTPIPSSPEEQATRFAYQFQTTATADALEYARAGSVVTLTAQAEEFSAEQSIQRQNLSLEATRSVATATQTALDLAMARAVEDSERTRDIANFWSSMIPASTVIFLALVLTLAFWMITRYFRAWLAWQEMRRSVIETRSGTMVWLADENGVLFPQLLEKVNRFSSRILYEYPPKSQAQFTEAKAEPLTRSGSVWMSPMKQGSNGDMSLDRTSHSLARWLIWEALQLAGPNSSKIPGWRHFDGWSAERWQRAVDVLKATGVVETEPRKGTYIAGEYENLFELQTAIDAKQLRLSPTQSVHSQGSNGQSDAQNSTEQNTWNS